MTVRRLLSLLAVASTVPFGAAAQPVNLPGGKYESLGHYLVGSWKYVRAATGNSVRLEFNRDHTCLVHTVTTKEHIYCRFGGIDGKVHLAYDRACMDDGRTCIDLNPPQIHPFVFVPVSANLFMSGPDRVERTK